MPDIVGVQLKNDRGSTAESAPCLPQRCQRHSAEILCGVILIQNVSVDGSHHHDSGQILRCPPVQEQDKRKELAVHADPKGYELRDEAVQSLTCLSFTVPPRTIPQQVRKQENAKAPWKVGEFVGPCSQMVVHVVFLAQQHDSAKFGAGVS